MLPYLQTLLHQARTVFYERAGTYMTITYLVILINMFFLLIQKHDDPCCKELLEEKATEESPRDAVLVQLEFLKTVRIVGFSKHRFVIKLIKNLRTYVRNIGKIIINTSPGTG